MLRDYKDYNPDDEEQPGLFPTPAPYQGATGQPRAADPNPEYVPTPVDAPPVEKLPAQPVQPKPVTTQPVARVQSTAGTRAPAPSQPFAVPGSGPGTPLYDAVAGMYQSLLGRAPENSKVVNDWISGSGGDIYKIQQGIYNSPEAKAYLSRNASTPGGAPNQLSVTDFIRQYQQSHPANGGIGPLAEALAANGYTNVGRFMYGQTPSNNELTIDGKKFKVLGNEDGPNPYWYTGGDDSAPTSRTATNPGYASTDFNAGMFPDPTQQVGNDPMSQLANGALSALVLNGGRISSNTGDKANAALENYLSGKGLNSRLESIREQMSRLQRTQLNDARGELASRGLLSEGSIAQGPEMSTIGRVEGNIAPIWSGAARDAITADNDNMLKAIQMATGVDEAASDRLLKTADSIGNRQQMLSDIALKSLDQNMAWNQFLAEYGLKRDQIQYQIQQGQTEALSPLIQAFIQWFDKTNGGFV